MEVITFSPDMDLSSKEAGDVFRLKLYGIEYDVKVVGDDEDPHGVIETLNRTEGEMPEIIAGVLKRIRDDIDKFVDNKTKDYENIQE